MNKNLHKCNGKNMPCQGANVHLTDNQRNKISRNSEIYKTFLKQKGAKTAIYAAIADKFGMSEGRVRSIIYQKIKENGQ